MPKAAKAADRSELSPKNFSPAKLRKWLDQNKKDDDEKPSLLLNLEAVEEASIEEEEEEFDELLKEVQKELHTRFKNMFESDMLLPNLEFNPEFEGSTEANLLNLEDDEAEKATINDADEHLVSLA